MSNLDELNNKLEIDEATGVQESEQKPSTSGMSGDRPPRRAGRRPGRRGGKMDERAKLERSRLSARECRARKKLRYQYLEDLVANREKAIFALRDELELCKQWCIQMDEGIIPQALLKLVQEASNEPDNQEQSADVVEISDEEDDSEDSGTENRDTEADKEDNYEAGTSTSSDVKVVSKIPKEMNDVSSEEGTMHSTAIRDLLKRIAEFENTSVRTTPETGDYEADTSRALLGATGSSSDGLTKTRHRNIVWNLGTVKFGTLDENLESMETDPYGLDDIEDNFNYQDSTAAEMAGKIGSRTEPSLPTIVEENEC